MGRQTNMLTTKGPNETKMLWVEQPLALALCFQVTEGEGYPEATQTRRVRRLLGEVLQLPGEQAADGILTVTCHPLVRWFVWAGQIQRSGLVAFVVGHAFYCACVIGTVQLYDSIVFFLAFVPQKKGHRPGMIQYSLKHSDQENTCTMQIWSDLSLLFLNIPRV